MAVDFDRYATQHSLPDGGMIVIGGRRQFSYEFVPRAGESKPTNVKLPLLRETTDEAENNLYPFVYLNTDGNLFIFANNRSILFDYRVNAVVREYPVLPGGARNYPSSGMSVLLPLDLRADSENIPAEVLVCGGSPSASPQLAAMGVFIPALKSCGRLIINKVNAWWRMEEMPTERVMGDMLLLPTADVLILNGAKSGCAGWNFAEVPNFEPVMYRPARPESERFFRLKPSAIPRMYHSTSAVLPDGKVLVAGSNTNNGYNYTGVPYPTELRVEKFSPPYLDPLFQHRRPIIIAGSFDPVIRHAAEFVVPIEFPLLKFHLKDAMVTMYMPPLTTHGYSMNQRMLILPIKEVRLTALPVYEIVCVAPATPQLAPPGYYLLSAVSRGVPSKAVWIHLRQKP